MNFFKHIFHILAYISANKIKINTVNETDIDLVKSPNAEMSMIKVINSIPRANTILELIDEISMPFHNLLNAFKI